MTIQAISCGIVGAGFVGGSLATILAERNVNVFQFDKAGKKSPGVNTPTFLSIAEMTQHCESQPDFSGIFFVAVPTPMNIQTGECDTSIVENCLRELANVPRSGYRSTERIAVVKSTVLPGSTQRWNQMFRGQLEVVHSPEFLREATCLEDMRNQDRIVLGGSETATAQVERLFARAFPGVPILRTSSTTSEMVKYTINCFLSTKVSFANEIYDVCQVAGVDYNQMIELVKLDKRVGQSHWQVPGPMPADDGSGKFLRGFAGSCFCKDLNSLIFFAKKNGALPTLMQAVWEVNLRVRPDRDWEHLKGRAVSASQSFRVALPMTSWKVPVHPAIHRIVVKPISNLLFGE